MVFFRSLPPFSSLSLPRKDLQLVSDAMDVIHRDDTDNSLPILPEGFFEGYPTSRRSSASMSEEDIVASIQKYIPRVQLMSSNEDNEVDRSIWPTAASLWIRVGLQFTLLFFTVADSATALTLSQTPSRASNLGLLVIMAPITHSAARKTSKSSLSRKIFNF
jgi:hypothetical protein